MTLFKKATIVLTILFLNTIITGTSKANDDICPDNMTLDQCYSYLTKKIADLDKQSKIVSGNLSAEKYNQLTLNQQIDYTKRKIAEAELEIQKTEIELETKNVEIRMIERDIEETQKLLPVECVPQTPVDSIHPAVPTAGYRKPRRTTGPPY